MDEFIQSFQERNPNIRVFSAHLHMDEATPHLHIDFVPFTTGSKRGLDTRVSLKKALAEQGFTGGTRGDTEWSQWVRSEKEQLSQVMERHGIEWEQLGTQNEHLSVLNYKKDERAKEVKQLEKKLVTVKKKVLDIEAIDKIEVKKVPLTANKVMLDQEDYDNISTAAKKHIVQVKKVGKLEKQLKAAEDTISKLQAENASLKQKASKHSSVREQLDVGKLKQENMELREANKSYREIIKEYGLDHLIDAVQKSIAKKRDGR